MGGQHKSLAVIDEELEKKSLFTNFEKAASLSMSNSPMAKRCRSKSPTKTPKGCLQNQKTMNIKNLSFK